MRYRLYFFSLLAVIFAFAQEISAQDQPPRPRTTRQRPAENTETNAVSNLTETAKIKNEIESQKPSHVVWERLIYRTIDLTKDNNAALYYPVKPQGNRQNLFTLIFKLLADGKITAYDYGDANEVFDEGHIKNFEEVLKTIQVLYTKQGEQFKVDERDIPSAEVTQYMIKEGYLFDQATGTFKNQVIAICPILLREDFYYGNSTKETLFWLKYDDIRPYLSREMMMTSNYNNALTYTIDDYFRKNMYTGEIVKTVNMMGKSLAQEVGNDTLALKHAQDSIESQLKMFNQKLWVYNDTTVLVPEKSKETKPAKEGRTVARGKSNSASSEKASTSTEKKTKEKQPKAEKATPARSVRRTR
ncbi:hypothetical protein AGMMS50262_09200 [Bacteroidia bacterium]|nr:hypothetical protein AGMMS50262_09200 [Bacteroidia bacterium]